MAQKQMDDWKRSMADGVSTAILWIIVVAVIAWLIEISRIRVNQSSPS